MSRENSRRAFHLTMLGLLCGGLLLTGIGVGVQLVEVSALSYGGERLLEDTPRSGRLVVDLGEVPGPVSISSYDSGLYAQLLEVGNIQVRDTVTPGTVELDLRYEGADLTPDYWVDVWAAESASGARQQVNLCWHTHSDLALLLSWKDRVLEDLRQGRIGDYAPCRLTGAVISVHPDDAQRVQLG